MKRIAQIITVAVMLLLAVGASVAQAQQGDISFAATVDPTTISTDDQLTLTLTLEGPVQNVPEPRLPARPNFWSNWVRLYERRVRRLPTTNRLTSSCIIPYDRQSSN